MNPFQPLTPESLPRQYFTRAALSDQTPGHALMWRDYLDTHFAVVGNALFLRFKHRDRFVYSYPFGGDDRTAVESLLQDIPDAVFCPVAAVQLPLYGVFGMHEEEGPRDWHDYLYLAEELSTFAGRRFNGQRNQVNKFTRAHPGWSFEPNPDPQESIAFLETLFAQRPAEDNMAAEEQKKVLEAFTFPRFYKFLTGAIRYEGEMLALSAGEIVGDTLFTHIEKADGFNHPGVYQAIVQSFATHYATDGVRLINREDDAGIPGLRTSKLSYHPCEIRAKYIVRQ